MGTKEINESVTKYCNLAIEYAKTFEIVLDFSDESIERLDEILEYYSEELRNASEDEKPTDNQIFSMATIWGAYLGEVMRKKIGEPCIWIIEDGDLLLQANKAKANPIGKAYKRIINGPEDSVWSFYDIISIKILEHIQEQK